MFSSNTYKEIEQKADDIWKFQRYSLVYEFYHKPFLPGPFMIVYYVFFMIFILLMKSIRRFFSAETINNNPILKLLFNATKKSSIGFGMSN
jgi:hypothetical protein